MAKKDKPRVALVIGSGSVKCAAALGLIKVFERAAEHQLPYIKKLLAGNK